MSQETIHNSRAIGVRDFLDKTFDTYAFSGNWLESFGEPEKNFRMVVYGRSGQGKTEFCLQLAKYMAGFGRVYYNTFEQGISKTMQDGLRRNNMEEVAGQLIFGNRETFPEMLARLGKKRSPRICFIDSRDYMNLTQEQYKLLIKRFPRKSFILVCWESGGAPKGDHAKAMLYMCDIKVQVNDFLAYPASRFGGNIPFAIWPERAKNKPQSPNLFNQ